MLEKTIENLYFTCNDFLKRLTRSKPNVLYNSYFSYIIFFYNENNLVVMVYFLFYDVHHLLSQKKSLQKLNNVQMRTL